MLAEIGADEGRMDDARLVTMDHYMDGFGQSYRSTGTQVSEVLSIPITIMEPSVVRWRWALSDDEQVHFSAIFTAAGAGKDTPVEMVLPEQLTSSHASSSMRFSQRGVLELRWSIIASDASWMSALMLGLPPPVMLEYECRVLPADELRRRARTVRVAALTTLAEEERESAAAIRQKVEDYKGPLEELRAQLMLIETHVREQEAEAEAAEAKAAAYDAERSRLLEDARADSGQEPAASERGMRRIPEEEGE